MKVLCAYSSVEFTCEHFPGYLSSREAAHPLFQVPQKKLLSYLGKWAQSGLTPTDSYLLFLALLNSSDLVDFRVPAIRTESTDAIIAQNMESLCKVLAKLNTVVSPAVVFPHYVISPETRTLDNVHYWITNWENAYQEFLSGYRSAHESAKLRTREAALERLIKNPHKPIASYAGQIADWAAVAGTFPTFIVINPHNSLKVSCADYWKYLIAKCAYEEQIFAIRRKDLEELLEHCEENIPIGSIYSNALFRIIRHALERQKNFLGLGDLDITKASYTILSADTSTEAANMRILVDSAPEHCPRPEEYPTKFAYMKAKLRWDMAQKVKRNGAAESGGGEL
jgi:hypothetical protein